MTASLEDVHKRIELQKTALPVMYGDVDFSLVPERYTDDITVSSMKEYAKKFPPPPADMVARVKAYTMLGDIPSDAYAALMPQYGFKRLVDMLTTACDEGIEAVPDAPPELAALIAEMEVKPDWLDMDLVREGARLNRLPMAETSPLMIRGAFLATFLNKYTALPMALTGTLSHSTASRRVNETATFFTVTTLPGALEPRGRVQGRRHGAPDALHGALQRAAPREGMGPVRLRYSDPSGGPDAGGPDRRVPAGLQDDG